MRSKTPVNNKTFHASKLINKYAESYLNKEEENSHLKSIILDLKTTLKCNKDIITTLTSNLNHDEKTKFLLDSYSKEVVLLNNKVESFTVEIQNLKEKLIYSEQVALENIFKEKNNYEKVEHKIFELENVIEKKEAEIYHLKKRNKKLDNYNEMGIGTHPGHEVFVLDPHEALIKLYDELNMFKEIYNNLSNHYNAQKGHIITYERTIEDLQYELNNVTRDLREKDKQLAIRFNNDGKEKNLNNKIIYQLDKNAKSDLKMSSKPNSKNNSINFNTYFNQGYNYKLDTSEWRDVVRIVGYNEEEYNNLFNIENNRKVIESIDILISQILEKNLQIELMSLENSKLNSEILILSDELLLFKKQKQMVDQKNDILNSNVKMLEDQIKILTEKNEESFDLSQRKSKNRAFTPILTANNSLIGDFMESKRSEISKIVKKNSKTNIFNITVKTTNNNLGGNVENFNNFSEVNKIIENLKGKEITEMPLDDDQNKSHLKEILQTKNYKIEISQNKNLKNDKNNIYTLNNKTGKSTNSKISYKMSNVIKTEADSSPNKLAQSSLKSRLMFKLNMKKNENSIGELNNRIGSDTQNLNKIESNVEKSKGVLSSKNSIIRNNLIENIRKNKEAEKSNSIKEITSDNQFKDMKDKKHYRQKSSNLENFFPNNVKDKSISNENDILNSNYIQTTEAFEKAKQSSKFKSNGTLFQGKLKKSLFATGNRKSSENSKTEESKFLSNKKITISGHNQISNTNIQNVSSINSQKIKELESILDQDSILENGVKDEKKKNLKEFTFDSCTSTQFKNELDKVKHLINESNSNNKNLIEDL